MFENKVPARKFKDYVCAGVEGMAAEAAGKHAVLRKEKAGTIHMETATDHSRSDA